MAQRRSTGTKMYGVKVSSILAKRKPCIYKLQLKSQYDIIGSSGSLLNINISRSETCSLLAQESSLSEEQLDDDSSQRWCKSNSGRLSLFSWFAGYRRTKVPSVTPFYVPQAFFLSSTVMAVILWFVNERQVCLLCQLFNFRGRTLIPDILNFDSALPEQAPFVLVWCCAMKDSPKIHWGSLLLGDY